MEDQQPGGPSFDEAEWDDAVAQVDRADEHIARGAFDEGLREANEAAHRLRSIVGADHPDYAQALVSAGDALSARGGIRDALGRFEEALAILDAYLGDPEAEPIVQPRRLSVLGRIGYLEALSGLYESGRRHLDEALQLAASLFGEDAPELSEHYNNLGVCLRFAAQYEEARHAYERAGALRAQVGLAHPASHFHNLSGLATAMEDYAAAERHARDAVATRERDEGRGFELGTDLCGLGDALAGLERFDEAEAAYREALALYAASRPDHPEVAFALHNLGDTLVSRGKPDAAEASYRESIRRKTDVFGEDSHEVAATLNNLAVLLADLDRTDEARHTIERALKICERVVAPTDPIAVACRSTASSMGS